MRSAPDDRRREAVLAHNAHAWDRLAEGLAALARPAVDAAFDDPRSWLGSGGPAGRCWLPHRLDGLEVLRRLRKHNASLPVLILSGRERPEDKVSGLDLGADDYLVKPFSAAELLARVRAVLRRAQPANDDVRIMSGPVSA